MTRFDLSNLYNFSSEEIKEIKAILRELNGFTEKQKKESHIGSLVVKLLTKDPLLWNQIKQVMMDGYSKN